MNKNVLFTLICLSLSFTTFASLKEMKKQYKRPAKVPFPADNKPNKDREYLGKLLFFETRISGSKVMSCATCHNPSLGWEDAQPLAVGHGHKILGRKTPTILNLAWAPLLFWDGRADSLEAQALGPIEAAGEMNMPLKSAVSSLKEIKGYKKLFDKAYPGEGITTKTIGKAIAAFERTVVSGEAPFDRWIKGNSKAISKSAANGFKLFNTKARCANCHSGWSFTDHSFHDIGLKTKDKGRAEHLPLPTMQFAFKTPGLRNITERAPYMHNGSEKTLEEVMDFYNRGGDVKRPSLSVEMKPLGLTKSEIKDVVAFLKTLTSKDKPISLPVLPQ